MSLESLTDAEREQIVALKLRYSYSDRTESDQVMTVSDLIDGQLADRPATFRESLLPLARELEELRAVDETIDATADEAHGL